MCGWELVLIRCGAGHGEEVFKDKNGCARGKKKKTIDWGGLEGLQAKEAPRGASFSYLNPPGFASFPPRALALPGLNPHIGGGVEEGGKSPAWRALGGDKKKSPGFAGKEGTRGV